MNDEELLRYSRHILLAGFDLEGQERLRAARVLVVGAGGLGCAAVLYLASSGVGQLVIADPDQVELSNLQRQVAFAQPDIGTGKAAVLANRAQALNPDCQVQAMPLRLGGEALQAAVAAVDLVLDCSDNFPTRHAVNRACVQAGKPLVSGAAIRFEGQVSVFDTRGGGPCYACLYGETRDEETPTCSEAGVLAPLVGVVGALQAAEAIKWLAGVGQGLVGRLLLADLLSANWREVRFARDPACPVCRAPAGATA